MSLSFGVLILVFLGIALRQILRIPLQIWQIMGIGACVVLFTGRISLIAAYLAIDWSIIFFLFGMFYVGQALEESGYIHDFASRLLHNECSLKRLCVIIVFGMGLFSALLMNDTLAIIGTPLLIKAAHHRKVSSHPLLLGLAFAITIGSVLSPIGNPQNLFIALGVPIQNPFITYLKYLAIPTLINLVLLYFLVFHLSKKGEAAVRNVLETPSYNKKLMGLSRIAIGMVALMILYNIAASFFPITSISLPGIALIPAFFLMIFAPKRKEIFKALDWHTLVFFMAMFILMKSVWDSSSIKELLLNPSPWMQSNAGILSVSTLASQLISNVPLVALYLPTLKEIAQGPLPYMALAAGSTIAGNFLIFGAASNLIIIQNAEKRGEKGISFFEFAKYGIPLTILNLAIYYLYLSHIMGAVPQAQ